MSFTTKADAPETWGDEPDRWYRRLRFNHTKLKNTSDHFTFLDYPQINRSHTVRSSRKADNLIPPMTIFIRIIVGETPTHIVDAWRVIAVVHDTLQFHSCHLQHNHDCAGSTWSKIFFPPEPVATLSMTPLTIFVASSSLSFPSSLTISCIGSLNYLTLSIYNPGMVRRVGPTFPAAMYSTSFPVTRARSCGLFCLYHSDCQNPCAVRLLNMNTEGGKPSASLAMAPYVTKWAFFPARRSIRVVDFPPTQFKSSRISYIAVNKRNHEMRQPHTFPPVHSFTCSEIVLSSRSS